MTTPPTDAGRDPWTVLRGPLASAQIIGAAVQVADRHRLMVHRESDRVIRLTGPDQESPVVTARWKPLPPQPPCTVGFQLTPPKHQEVLIEVGPGFDAGPARALGTLLEDMRLPYTETELDGITAARPLVRRYSVSDPGLKGWALLFRDHYLEHSVGFLLGMERAGITPEWIYALDKGDRTYNRDRVHATFLTRGYRSGLLDNAAVNDPDEYSADLAHVNADIDAFIDAAHESGRKVLVVDDGGLLAQGRGVGTDRRIDAAIELTVSGVKRIEQADTLSIPVLNMARSQTKTLLGYPEIADSCMRRLRNIIPDRKFIGRQVLLIGYGTLGSRLAPALRTLGCRVDVVDTDIAALIAAAEAGYPTHRSAAEALRAVTPFLLIGTTGEVALTGDDLDLLPDGVHLAPFATRDFSVLTEDLHARSATGVPGVGRCFHFVDGRTAVLLGDGRSMNLFEADSVPNQGYDAYRAGTLIAAKYLCANADQIPHGLHREPADDAIAAAGLFDAYYDLYLAAPAANAEEGAQLRVRENHQVSACVIGYGIAGKLHTEILTELGADVMIIDPKHQDLPKTHHSFPNDVGRLPTARAAGVDLWSICCPTAAHLSVLRAVLEHNPAARVLLEKPACQGHEIEELSSLLAAHPQARVLVNDQYRHSTVLPAFTDLIDRLEGDAPFTHTAVTFTKDRTADIGSGRFIDHTYGVLGYEWLHMLAVLSHVLPAPLADAYFRSAPGAAELWATYDPRLFVSALTERTAIEWPGGGRTRLELASSILGPSVLLGTRPQLQSPWRRDIRPADDRHRHIRVEAGATRFTLYLEPVTAPGGLQLDRNHHRLTAERAGQIVHDEVVEDSPMSTAIRHAMTTLLDSSPLPDMNLVPLQRIASLAEILRTRAPYNSSFEPAGAG